MFVITGTVKSLHSTANTSQKVGIYINTSSNYVFIKLIKNEVKLIFEIVTVKCTFAPKSIHTFENRTQVLGKTLKAC